MEYETVYGKKEKYGDIITQFENARKRLYDEDRGLCSPVWDEDEKGRREGDGNIKAFVISGCSAASFSTISIPVSTYFSFPVFSGLG